MNRCDPNSVRAVLLAGIHGWGESPLDAICSRPLLPLLGRPVFWYTLEWLRRSGISEASVCANSQTRIFRRCLGDGSAAGLDIAYYEDLMPRGPAGCVRDASLSFGADTFLVAESSILPDFPLLQLLEAHQSSGAALTAVVCPREREAGHREELEPAGLYVASRSAVEQVGSKGYQDLKEMWLPRLHELKMPVLGFRVRRDRVLRISGMKSYLTAAGAVLERVAEGAAGFIRVGEALVHASAVVHPSARCVGQVLIGPGTSIGPAVTLIGPTVIGAGCRIESEAVVSLSSIWSHATVRAGAIAQGCVLPAGGDLEPGVIVRDTVCMTEGAKHIRLEELYWAMERDVNLQVLSPAPARQAARIPFTPTIRHRRRHSLEQDTAYHPEEAQPGFRRKHASTPD